MTAADRAPYTQWSLVSNGSEVASNTVNAVHVKHQTAEAKIAFAGTGDESIEDEISECSTATLIHENDGYMLALLDEADTADDFDDYASTAETNVNEKFFVYAESWLGEDEIDPKSCSEESEVELEESCPVELAVLDYSEETIESDY